jgi:hypothetical protein
MSLNYEDVVNAMKKLRKEGWLPSEPEGTREKAKTYGKLFNPSKRYQVTVGITGFGTPNAHVIPINEFDHEDWECPRCHKCMQDQTVFLIYKDINKKISCKHCDLELWRESIWETHLNE